MRKKNRRSRLSTLLIDKVMVEDSELEVVAINRLDKFLNSMDSKLETLEAMLPSYSSSGSSSYRPSLNRLKQRGKRIVKWGKSQVSGVPAYAMRKMGQSPDETPEDNQEGESIIHLYKFLKTTTQEFNSREGTPLESDAATMVDTNSAVSLEKFSRIWDEHFNAGVSGEASFHSSSSTLVSSASSQTSKTSQRKSCSSVSTEQLLQNLDYLDGRLDTLIEDPESVAECINFYNYEKALEIGRHRHLHYYELPFPWRENRFVIHGYRFYDSYTKCLLSIINWYGWHNETTNIWSHLIGAAYSAFLLFHGFSETAVYQSAKIPSGAIWMANFFLVASIKCFMFSVTWHTCNGFCNLRQRSRCACFDYSGITILITASIMTTEFVCLSSHSGSPYTVTLLLYMIISFALGAGGVFMNWSPKFDRPESRPFRIAFYILLASMGGLSFVHSSCLNGLAYTSSLMRPVFMKSLIWYLTGVGFYGSFIPERWRTDIQVDECIPTNKELSTDLDIITKHKHIHFRELPTKHAKCDGKHEKSFKSLWWVDYICGSHTIWHFFVLCGVIGHYEAILDMYQKRWMAS